MPTFGISPRLGALDMIVKFRREGTEVAVIGLNPASSSIVDQLGSHNKSAAVERMLEH